MVTCRAIVDVTPHARRLVLVCALRLAAELLRASSIPARRTVEAELPVTLEQLAAGRPARLRLEVLRGGRRVEVAIDVPLSPPWASCTLSGAGDDLLPGDGVPLGNRGDVRVTLRVEPHGTWRAAAPPPGDAPRVVDDGAFETVDLIADVALDPVELYYGRAVALDHPSGSRLEARHEAWPPRGARGSSAYDLGSVHVVRGAGLPTPDGGRGDAYVFFTLRMPALDRAHLARPEVRAAMALAFGAGVDTADDEANTACHVNDCA